jgi:hypothetical protein
MILLSIGIYLMIGIIFTLIMISIEPMIMAAGWYLLLFILTWPYMLLKAVFVR